MMIEHICAEPDIYRIEVPLPNNPLRYLNSYVVRGRDRFLVIDTGFNRPECRERCLLDWTASVLIWRGPIYF